MKRLLLVVALVASSLPVLAVNGPKPSKNKVSTKAGTLFFHWGYNRSWYTQSALTFQGQGYDFTMSEAKAHDHPAKFGKTYFNPKTITVPQFNVRVGYNISDNWAISIGYDHMKYIFADNNAVVLNGFIEPGLDDVSNLSGNYTDFEMATEREKFHYENSDGLNFIRAEVTRMQDIYFTKDRNFGIAGLASVSAGGVLSFNDFRFAGVNTMRTISLSGYGIAAHVGLRFEFFKHVYLQANYGGGFIHQVNVKNRPTNIDATARTSQKFGYMDVSGVLGAMFYIRGKNGCNTCPSW